MKTVITSLIVVLLTLPLMQSCRETAKENETTTEATTEAESTPAETPEKARIIKQTDTKGETALNPAHGQPGHRCDIPVGADLNSTPAKSQTPLLNQGTTGKLNPAHGQPGHRCDIKVGDPL